MKDIPTARDSREGAYQCGYNPDGRSLSETVHHWHCCDRAQCKQSLLNWLRFKREVLTKHGSGSPVESLEDYPDVERRPAKRMEASA